LPASNVKQEYRPVKKLISALMLATALVAPGLAMARDITIETTMVRYSGHAAYVAVYLTKPDGSYDSTLWVAGRKTKYYRDLPGWISAASTGGQITLDGITGASVGSGETLTVHADLADTLLDAGYQIHVDTAVENGFQFSDDAVIDLNSAPATVSGTGYVSKIAISL
jgi:hypothetical protein